MEKDPEQQKAAEEVLGRIREEFGFVPVVNQVLSDRPDVFLPMSELGRAVLEKGDIDLKHRRLCAISAAAALGGEYCLDVQTRHAIDAGATKDEIFEAMMIGSYMAMTRSESYAFRKLASNFGMELE